LLPLAYVKKTLKNIPKKEKLKNQMYIVSFLMAKLTLLILETRGIILEKFKL
jgi:hypothetical protein